MGPEGSARWRLEPHSHRHFTLPSIDLNDVCVVGATSNGDVEAADAACAHTLPHPRRARSIRRAHLTCLRPARTTRPAHCRRPSTGSSCWSASTRAVVDLRSSEVRLRAGRARELPQGRACTTVSHFCRRRRPASGRRARSCRQALTRVDEKAHDFSGGKSKSFRTQINHDCPPLGCDGSPN